MLFMPKENWTTPSPQTKGLTKYLLPHPLDEPIWKSGSSATQKKLGTAADDDEAIQRTVLTRNDDKMHHGLFARDALGEYLRWSEPYISEFLDSGCRISECAVSHRHTESCAMESRVTEFCIAETGLSGLH